MKKILILSLASILMISGCSLRSTDRNATTDAGPKTQEVAPSEQKVSITDFSFSPASLTIKLGGSVTWTNDDQAPHSIVGSDFKSAILNTGESFTKTFAEPGIFDYGCELHPGMRGSILVQ